MAYENTDNGTGAGGAEPGVSDSLRTFGAVVQALREHAGLSREEFADLVGFSKHTVASVEQGRRTPDRDFVERGETALGETGALRRAAPHLSRQAGLASWFRQWARLEAQAVTLWTYECRVVPGLLQTERYARAVTESVPPVKDEEQVAKQVAARLERQQLFARRPPIAFSFIVEQALVERGTGGPDVMRELLDHLLGLSLAVQRRAADHAAIPTGSCRLRRAVDAPGVSGQQVVQLRGGTAWRHADHGSEGGQHHAPAVCETAFTGSHLRRLQEPVEATS
ncbi:transcriptional regulator with XRE-family HTH domain [Streptomyces sp. B3I7]|nr:transcriptional regulator with XRE-family HTH domain [Streptomyces sp. B3I7]